MRSCRIPCLLLSLLLVLCLVQGGCLQVKCLRWDEQLADIDQSARAEAWTEVQQLLNVLYADWENASLWLHITAEHDEVDEAEMLFCRALVLAQEENSAEFRAHLADLRTQLRLLGEREQLRLGNIL